MRCAALHISRPILVIPRSRIFARSCISTSVRSTSDRITQSKLHTSISTGLLSYKNLDHRIRNIPSVSCSRYSTTTPSKSTNDDDHSALNPLPLPHSINPSKGLFLFHLPIPPKYWPSHLDLYFPLLRKTTKWMKEKGIVVNCIYDGIGTDTGFKEGGGHVVRLFTQYGNVKWDGFEEGVLGSEGFRGEVDRVLVSSSELMKLNKEEEEEVKEILVCTHGNRDCRCSNLGGQLVESLRAEIGKRGLGMEVREIAHVGGHKYAANAITLPRLDMYSNLLPTDASAMLDHLTHTSSPTESGEAFVTHWRGRYGCTESEQDEIWAIKNPHLASEMTATAKETTVGEAKGAAKEQVELKFKTYEGDLRVVKASIGDTLLQVARANDLPSMEGSCGGNLECSTCHLYIPPNCPIPEPTDPELDMLGYALGFKDDESRLGCQIVVSDEMVGWCQGGGFFGLPRY